MSFLYSSFSELPKSCQTSISRCGRCPCLSCLGAYPPVSSSSSRSGRCSGSGSKTSLRTTWSKTLGSRSTTNINGDVVLEAGELYLLTILAGADMSRPERDVDLAEASCMRSPGSGLRYEGGEKRRRCFSSEEPDKREEAELHGERALPSVWRREALAPSSLLQWRAQRQEPRQRLETKKRSGKGRSTLEWD